MKKTGVTEFSLGSLNVKFGIDYSKSAVVAVKADSSEYVVDQDTFYAPTTPEELEARIANLSIESVYS